MMCLKSRIDIKSTVFGARMSRWKWRETKLQPSRARSGHQISCCLSSLHFLCDIQAPITVHVTTPLEKKHVAPLGASGLHNLGLTQTHRDRPEMGGGNKGWRRVRVFTINDVELPTLLPPSPRMENWKTATDSLFL